MSPPGPLRLQHQHAIEALEFRVSGLRGLADAIHAGVAVAEERDRQRAAPRRPGGAPRLRRRGLGRSVQGPVDRGAAPPGRHRRRRFPTRRSFRTPTTRARASGRRSSSASRARRRRAARAAACTGPASSTVKALPGNQELSATTENTVTATTDLGFAVTIEDTGDSQEVQVKVTLTIQQSPSPIVADEDDRPDQPGRAEDGHLPQSRPGAVRDPYDREGRRPARARGEEHRATTRASYPVIFSLG